MNSELEVIFDQAEGRYLKLEELKSLAGYVGSLPERIEAYKRLRDRELDMVQQVADQIQVSLPSAEVEDLERGIKNLLVSLRYCAMAMLLNDETFLRERLLHWLEEINRAFELQAINEALYRLLNQGLKQELSVPQWELLRPYIAIAQAAVVAQPC
ncbi:hypothetical protein [Leptolyngbya sp. FACHB-261]|uniref:hypothetical protein n=1 Tax=Leptolyngbya sp. FACHB-261 TaxID=2692806 RepID=UPI001687EDD9|nr:hypothetical protein [Leptolyngbya sp. FACHB-261]MBD2101161.1 hypothetical protein [Leptolyngbya sp. FACHB-261]